MFNFSPLLSKAIVTLKKQVKKKEKFECVERERERWWWRALDLNGDRLDTSGEKGTMFPRAW